MLAMQDSRVRESFADRSGQLAQQQAPVRKSRVEAHVSVWNRISAFGCIGFCTLILWFIAGVGARIESMNNDIYHMQVEMQTVSANNASLTAKVDKLTDPTRVLNLAMNQYHMKYKSPIVIQASNP